jgi:hypothetical protein
MSKTRRAHVTRIAIFFFSVLLAATAIAADNCSQFPIDPMASSALGQVSQPAPGYCHARFISGFPTPDPACTPGAINPTITAEVLRNHSFRTRCLRNMATTEQEKGQVYAWYGIRHPRQNFGAIRFDRHAYSIEEPF